MKTTAIIVLLVGMGLTACGPAAGQVTPVVSAVTRLDRLKTTLYGADDVARLTSIAQLETDGSPEAVTLLGNFLLDATGTGRLEAARALLRLNTDQSLGYIRKAMADKELTTRRQSAMQALEGDGEAAYPFLKVLMRDTDETVRLNSLQVIQFLGSAQARALLQIALGDPSPQVQQAAAEALRALGYVPSPTP